MINLTPAQLATYGHGGNTAPIDRDRLQAHLASLQAEIATASPEVLAQVHRAQQIEAHNAMIEKKQAGRKKLREMAKQARITVPVLKKMLSSVKR